MSKWIEFVKQPKLPATKKTDVFCVYNKETRDWLGNVKWHGPFRQYSFFPTGNCVFEKKCLKDITDFLEKLMNDWRVQKKK